MKLYELSGTGRKLTNMFLEEEIDEQTLEDSRELIKAEIEVNGVIWLTSTILLQRF